MFSESVKILTEDFYSPPMSKNSGHHLSAALLESAVSLQMLGSARIMKILTLPLQLFDFFSSTLDQNVCLDHLNYRDGG